MQEKGKKKTKKKKKKGGGINKKKGCELNGRPKTQKANQTGRGFQRASDAVHTAISIRRCGERGGARRQKAGQV
jgi:hypothetical protein